MDSAQNGAKTPLRALFTTTDDTSLELLRPYFADIFYYHEMLDKLPDYRQYDVAYFRDPFNDLEHRFTRADLEQILTNFFKSCPDCRSIDHIYRADDFYLEDKYAQFQRLGTEFMAPTWLGNEVEFQTGKQIAKPRISSRVRNFLFAVPADKPLGDDFIVQDRLNIQEELRVYVLHGKVIPLATIKSSKTEQTKVKVITARQLKPEENDFVKSAMQHFLEYDLTGVDLAILDDGTLRIIEVNRSPQFASYQRVTGVDLAEEMFND